jgi:D-amino-acid dehydrogenase
MKDVVIIGGGVAGLWCAYHLQNAGRQVLLLDRNHFEDGCSFGNAGMIVPSHFIPMASPGIIAQGIRWMFKKESPFYIRPRLNLELAQWLFLFYKASTERNVSNASALLRDLHEESRESYRMINNSKGFHFGFEQKGILMLYKTAAAEKDELETAELAHALGIEVNSLKGEELDKLEPGVRFDVLGAMHYPGDAHMIPHLFVEQMIHDLKSKGVEFQGGVNVLSIRDSSESCEITPEKGAVIKCKQMVVAAGSWSGKLMKQSGHKLPMQDGKGYSMTIPKARLKPSVPSILHEARVAITPMRDHLRVSGTLEISGMDNKIRPHKVQSILKAVPSYYPGLVIEDIPQVWFGYRPCTPDGLPYVGRLHSGSKIILATGHAMMGLSLAPATGRLVSEIMQGQDKQDSILDPSRFG